MYRHEVHGTVGKDVVKGTSQLPVPFEGICGNTQGTAGGDADLPAGFLFPPPVTYVTGFFLGNLRSPNPLLFMKTKKRTIQGFAVRDLSDKGGSRLPKGM